MLNSPVRLKITNNLVPIFYLDKNKISFKKNIPDLVEIPNYNNHDYAFVKFSKKKLVQYIRDENKSFIDIEKISIAASLTTDYSEKYKLMSNENSMGIFLKSANESLLIGNLIINKIHRFINGDKTYFNKNY